VVEVLRAWETIIHSSTAKSRIETYVKVKHLRLDKELNIEWLDEKLNSSSRDEPSGSKKAFHSVIVAVGFGLEPNALFPYWRNESGKNLQPHQVLPAFGSDLEPCREVQAVARDSKRYLVALTHLSWNQIVPWLQELDLLRQSVGFATAERGNSRTETGCSGPDSRPKSV